MAAIDRMLCQAAEHFLYIGTEEIFMSVSYKKLWKLLIDKDMKKKDLCEKVCYHGKSRESLCGSRLRN